MECGVICVLAPFRTTRAPLLNRTTSTVFAFPSFRLAIMAFIKTEPIPMTRSARDSLIAISMLWAVFATTVSFRLAGRIRGIGLGLDDILSVVALVRVRSKSAMTESSLTMLRSSCQAVR